MKSFIELFAVYLSILTIVGLWLPENIHAISPDIEIHEIDVFTMPFENVTLNIPINMSGENTVFLSGEWENQSVDINYSITPLQGEPPFTAKLDFSPFQRDGTYVYLFWINGSNTTTLYKIKIKVTDTHIDFQTDKNSYLKGERIRLSGNVTFLHEKSLNSINLTISCGDMVRYRPLKLINGSFNFNYTISFGDPEGTWGINVSGLDSDGNIVYKCKSIDVSLPQNTARYKVTFLSPSRGAVYVRGSSIDISVFVSSDNEGVSGLMTQCVLPDMRRINLTDLGNGYYVGKLDIPWSGKEGEWFLSVESRSVENEFAGGASINFIVEKAPLKIDILKPSKKIIETSKELKIELSITYPDGEPVDNAHVEMSIGSNTQEFSYIGEGKYSTLYTIDNGCKYLTLSIAAVDTYENTGHLDAIFYVTLVSSTHIDMISLISLTAAVGVVGIILFHTRNVLSEKRLHEIKRELNEVRRLQRDAVVRYYREGSISREVYDTLMQEYSKRYLELMDMYENLLARKSKKKFRTPF